MTSRSNQFATGYFAAIDGYDGSAGSTGAHECRNERRGAGKTTRWCKEKCGRWPSARRLQRATSAVHSKTGHDAFGEPPSSAAVVVLQQKLARAKSRDYSPSGASSAIDTLSRGHSYAGLTDDSRPARIRAISGAGRYGRKRTRRRQTSAPAVSSLAMPRGRSVSVPRLVVGCLGGVRARGGPPRLRRTRSKITRRRATPSRQPHADPAETGLEDRHLAEEQAEGRRPGDD